MFAGHDFVSDALFSLPAPLWDQMGQEGRRYLVLSWYDMAILSNVHRIVSLDGETSPSVSSEMYRARKRQSFFSTLMFYLLLVMPFSHQHFVFPVRYGDQQSTDAIKIDSSKDCRS